jgi:formamidopyrimidine-DNA glycosylase
MPELPEVEALAAFLRERAVGRTLTRIDLATINALATYDPPLPALHGRRVADADRHGKFLDVTLHADDAAEPLHLVVHLARAGWLHWREPMPSTVLKMGKGPIAARVHLAGPPASTAASRPAAPVAVASSEAAAEPMMSGADVPAGFDLTEAGTKKGLSISCVRHPTDVPGIARLGVDPLDPEFTVERLAGLLDAAGGRQLKGVLRSQSVVAGIGNAYSDEALHAARMSPFRPANRLDAIEIETLHAAIRGTLQAALGSAHGLAAAQLKGEKRSNMRVHGRAGQPCPACGDTVREVSFADSALQYCPTCQTGGKPLADRRLSRLLK